MADVLTLLDLPQTSKAFTSLKSTVIHLSNDGSASPPRKPHDWKAILTLALHLDLGLAQKNEKEVSSSFTLSVNPVRAPIYLG